MKRYILLNKAFLFLVIIFLGCNGNKEEVHSPNYENGNHISEFNRALTEAIIEDQFSPPVASRIYAYSNIAAFEVMRNYKKDKPSLSVALNEMPVIEQPNNEPNINYELAALVAFVKVAKSLVYTETGLIEFEKLKTDSLAGLMDESILKQSIEYGNLTGDKIIEWADSDNFKQTRGAERYSLLKTEGSWEPTPPDYTQAIEPHWQTLRPFVLPSSDVFRPDSMTVAFSKEKSSEFYIQALDVYNTVLNLDSEQVDIAKFWDDNPVVSEHAGHMMVKNKKMTPGGHWMYITMLAVKDFNLEMTDASYTFALTAIAIADAFIAAWDGKYHFQLIRPVTYIHNNISTDWIPILQTPPFPEHPSAHSAISAAAATVLSDIFGDQFAFTDSSEVRFGLPVRSFESFRQAADEVAMSRKYGGIHYTFSNEAGVSIGKQVGALVLEKNKVNNLATKTE